MLHLRILGRCRQATPRSSKGPHQSPTCSSISHILILTSPSLTRNQQSGAWPTRTAVKHPLPSTQAEAAASQMSISPTVRSLPPAPRRPLQRPHPPQYPSSSPPFHPYPHLPNSTNGSKAAPAPSPSYVSSVTSAPPTPQTSTPPSNL